MSSRDGEARPEIARIWRGRVRSADADSYARYLREAGIPPLEATALGVQMLQSDCANETTFVTISWWESVEAMTRFTGGDPFRVHHLERDPEFLLELPKCVDVFEVKDLVGFPAALRNQRTGIGHTIVI